jgi:hypothetical protein
MPCRIPPDKVPSNGATGRCVLQGIGFSPQRSCRQGAGSMQFRFVYHHRPCGREEDGRDSILACREQERLLTDLRDSPAVPFTIAV